MVDTCVKLTHNLTSLTALYYCSEISLHLTSLSLNSQYPCLEQGEFELKILTVGTGSILGASTGSVLRC